MRPRTWRLKPRQLRLLMLKSQKKNKRLLHGSLPKRDQKSRTICSPG